MKKLVLSISMFLIAATTFAQSEVVTDSIPPISLDGYKNFNGFMLDMGSMIMAPPPLIAPQLISLTTIMRLRITMKYSVPI